MRKILFLLLTLLPMLASARVYVNGLYYDLNGYNATVVGCNNSNTNVTIPRSITYDIYRYTVTSIGSTAFYACYNVTSITIPNSVTSIGDNAFQFCSGLTSIEIPNSVTKISDRTFYGCTKLASIIFPNTITYVGEEAFEQTPWLSNQPDGLIYVGKVAFKYKGSMPSGTSITLQEGTVGIANKAFMYCSGLTNIDIPNSVTYIDNNAFYSCKGLTSINIPNSVTSIGNWAFMSCEGLTSIEIPNSITTISAQAFRDCKGARSILIPNSVTTIGGYAFSGCSSLTSIEIPNSVRAIGNGAFSSCSSLTTIKVANDNPCYDSRNNCNAIIETATNTLLTGSKNTLIPQTVKSIGDKAFELLYNLESIVIPSSVESIGTNAFYGCKDLKNVKILGNVNSLGTHAFTHYLKEALNVLEFYGNINCSGEDVFAESINYGYQPRGINNMIIGEHVDSIKSTKIKPTNAVYCLNPVPPVIDQNTFVNYNVTLHVPASSLAAYFTAPYWENFSNIVGDVVAVQSINLSQTDLEISLREHKSLTATVIPANANPQIITWASSNPSIASVSNGNVSAKSSGECDIIAYCGETQAVCHVIVNDNDTTVTISLDQQEAMVLPNHIITLTPSASPFMPAMTVSSSDPSVAAARLVNNKIQVVGIKEGTTTITVGSVDGAAIPATCLVTVYTEPGDMNCDGFVNISDVTSLIDYLLSGDDSQISTKNADVNGDENINISDVTNLIDILLSGNG